MTATTWTDADAAKAQAAWADYQRTHDVSDRHGQAVGIDPHTGRVWFGPHGLDAIEAARADGIATPLLLLRVGYPYYQAQGWAAMIVGIVTSERKAQVVLTVAGRDWTTIVDSGFNGDLELPDALRPFVNARFAGEVVSLLASNQQVRELAYRVAFPFDGRDVPALATFVPGDSILIDTGLLDDYWLEIHFPNRTVRLERVAATAP